jgi:hypothetical protein
MRSCARCATSPTATCGRWRDLLRDRTPWVALWGAYAQGEMGVDVRVGAGRGRVSALAGAEMLIEWAG